jgi:hypothetical protein
MVGGLLAAGAPYSLFVSYTQGFHKRTHRNPFGDISKDSIKNANILVSNLCVLIALAYTRRVHLFLEQEYTSRMWLLSRMAACVQLFKMKRIWCQMMVFGARSFYCCNLYTTLNIHTAKTNLGKRYIPSQVDETLRAIKEKLMACTWFAKHKSAGHFRKAKKVYMKRQHRLQTIGDNMYLQSIDLKALLRCVQGGRDLAQHGSYPVRFCKAVYETWEATTTLPPPTPLNNVLADICLTSQLPVPALRQTIFRLRSSSSDSPALVSHGAALDSEVVDVDALELVPAAQPDLPDLDEPPEDLIGKFLWALRVL